MRVLFWGTPEFAVPPLRALLGEGFEVVGVVTRADRPAGRGRTRMAAPPVKEVALAEGIPVLQPERPRGAEFLAGLERLEPDISVVVAYGHILPQAVLDLPRLGSINIHASLLPKLRGAAPIQGAILAGHPQTGVTIMRMVQALDAGPIMVQRAIPIADDETFGELQMRLSELGASAVIEALTLLELGVAREEPQDDGEATYAPKIDRAMARVDWGRPAAEVARAIRAFDPRPGAFTVRDGSDIKLFGASPAPRARGDAPGTVTAVGGDGLTVACGEGAVRIAAVQPAGKRRMTPREWAAGRGIAEGDRLGA